MSFLYFPNNNKLSISESLISTSELFGEYLTKHDNFGREYFIEEGSGRHVENNSTPQLDTFPNCPRVNISSSVLVGAVIKKVRSFNPLIEI